MTIFKDVFMSSQIDPTKWYDGQFWGWQECQPRCKVCQTCTGFRHFIEFFLRCNVPYRQIISIVEEITAGKLIFNKPNLSLHRQKHMVDDLVSVKFLPEGQVGLLLPRWFLKQVPYKAENGQILLSKCLLPYCGCEWQEPEGCSFQGGLCPAKNLKIVQDSQFVIDCKCPICTSPSRLLIESLAALLIK